MNIPEKDKSILRQLAGDVATIAALPDHAETAERWKRLNDLQPTRPLVRIHQVPWREMDVNDELKLLAQDSFCRGMEADFREILYRWKHMPVDMIVEPVYYTSYAIHSTGVGIEPKMDTIPHDKEGGISAQYYHNQIDGEQDLERIKMPVVSCDWEATEEAYQKAREILDGILQVRKLGVVAHNYAPWDRLATWWNPQQVLMDLILRPELIHKAMDRLVSAYLSELDQIEELNLLSLGNGNFGVGQGGLGYTGELPQPGFDPRRIRLRDQWCGAMAQIFSEVSPDMHEEFALQYESRYLKRFGLAYYGCCEPLHHKVDIAARHIPNLRKISMSAWVDAKKGAEAIGDRFVFSFKPNPAFLATDGQWDSASARRELETVLDVTRGGFVEIILKDISTVRYGPQRLWEWSRMAMDVVATVP